MKLNSSVLVMASIAMASMSQRDFYTAPQFWDKGIDEKAIAMARRNSRRAKIIRRKRK